MRFVELIVTDCLEEPVLTRTEWIHRDHIESVEAWSSDQDGQGLWLELTLTSGRVRYVPIAGLAGDDGGAVGEAMRVLLDEGRDPVRAAR